MSHFSTIQVKISSRESLLKMLDEQFVKQGGHRIEEATGNELLLKNYYHQPSVPVAIKLVNTQNERNSDLDVIGFELNADGTFNAICDDYLSIYVLYKGGDGRDPRRQMSAFTARMYARQTQIDTLENLGYEWEETTLQTSVKLEDGTTIPAGTLQIKATVAASNFY